MWYFSLIHNGICFDGLCYETIILVTSWLAKKVAKETAHYDFLGGKNLECTKKAQIQNKPMETTQDRKTKNVNHAVEQDGKC